MIAENAFLQHTKKAKKLYRFIFERWVLDFDLQSINNTEIPVELVSYLNISCEATKTQKDFLTISWHICLIRKKKTEQKIEILKKFFLCVRKLDVFARAESEAKRRESVIGWRAMIVGQKCHKKVVNLDNRGKIFFCVRPGPKVI